MAKSETAASDAIELEVPDRVGSSQQAVEIVRAFIADGSLAVALNARPFGEQVGDWGRVLAQIAHHAARAAALNGQMADHEALAAIRQAFDRALSTSQPTMSGDVRGRVRH